MSSRATFLLSYLTFAIIGIAVLISGTTYLLSISFFHTVFEKQEIDDYFVHSLEYFLQFGNGLGQMVGLLCQFAFLFLLPQESVLVSQVRRTLVVLTFVSCFLVLLLSAVIPALLEYSLIHPLLIYFMLNVGNVTVSAATGFLVGIAFSEAAIFSGTHVQGVMAGLALAGSASAFLHIIVKLLVQAFRLDAQLMGMIETQTCFVIAGLIQLWAAGSYLLLTQSAHYKQNRLNVLQKPQEESHESIDENTALTTIQNTSAAHREVDLFEEEDGEFLPQSRKSPAMSPSKFSMHARVLMKTFLLGAGVFITFAVTFALFPILADIPSTTALKAEGWFTLLLFFAFHIGDTIGRMSPSWHRVMVFPARLHWVLVLLRLLFVPLIMFCVNPRWIVGDVFTMSLVFLFGLTHGYVGSIGMMLGPSLVEPHEREACGVLMVLCLNGGLFFGGLFGLGVQYLVPQKQ